MSTFFERYEEMLPMNPAVIRLTKLVVLMSFAAHLAVSDAPACFSAHLFILC